MADKSAFGQFLEDNTKGSLNKAFLGLSAVEIAQADNKLKALVKTLFQLILFKPLIMIGLAGAFSAMGKSIRSLVKDTGSLEAALQRLARIQGFQRIFSPLLGGLDAAKLRVAALVNQASQSKLFNFEQFAAASQSLEVLTHGVYSSTDALSVLERVSGGTGNGIEASADAVGGFYDTLRAGQPIDSAAEKLRTMGLISDATKTQLIALQHSGATNAQVFDALTKALASSADGMQELGDDVESVNAAYEKARTNLMTQFASPFVESDIRNTRNMTDAMNAIAPTVGRVSSLLQLLTNGFSTVKTAIAKTAAENSIFRSALELAADAGAILLAAVSTLSAIGLAAWLFGAAGAAAAWSAGAIAATGATGALATAITALGIAARVAMIATGIGIIIAVITTAVGVYMNFAHASEQAAKALEEQKKAHDETTAAMQKQISAAQTLREKQEALAKSIEQSKDAYKEYQQALAAKQEKDDAWFGIKKFIFGDESDRIDKRAGEAARNLQQKQATARALQAQGFGAGSYVTPERAQSDIEVDKARARLANDQSHAVALDNLGSFAQNYERLRGIYGDKDAKDKALALTSAQITEQAAAPVADHLAKLGLGGEAGSGTDVQKQIRDLQRDALRYLQSIDAKTGASRVGENKPKEDYDY